MGLLVGGAAVDKVFVGNTPASKVYLGNTQVWPVKKMYYEPFTANLNWGWTQFVMNTSTSDYQRAQCANGVAGITNASGTARPVGYFNKSDLGTDSHYVDVTLANPIAGTFANSHQYCEITMRRQVGHTSDNNIRFSFSPDGSLVIETYNGTSYTQRASVTGKNLVVGHVLRCVARDNGLHAVYNLTTDPNMVTPLIQWTDGTRILKYDAAHRTAGMAQNVVYSLFVQYSCHALADWRYGDL